MSAVFDVEAFEERCLGEEDLILEILRGSMKDLNTHIGRIRAYLERREYGNLERSAHALKGTSGTLSALQIHETAAELELTARKAARDQSEAGDRGEKEDKNAEGKDADYFTALTELFTRTERENADFCDVIRKKYPLDPE